MNNHRVIMLATSTALVANTYAQRSYQRDLAWNDTEVVVTRQPPRSDAPQLWFVGAFAHADAPSMPVFHDRFELGQGTTAIQVDLEDARYLGLSSAEAALLAPLGRLAGDVRIDHQIGYHRKRPVALIEIVPFRRNPMTGETEKLVSFRIRINELKRGGGQAKANNYPDHSKLASGEWFRFAVAQDGVYRITYSFLQQLGVNVIGLASDQINIYGNHFGQLPYRNDDTRATDLLLNAIQVDDGGDGVFGPDDQILFHATGPHRWTLRSNGLFSHVKNVFCDSAYYFIGIGTDAPKRIGDAVTSGDSPTHTVTSFNDRQFIDRDNMNPIKSGRQFFGEVFDLVDQYNYNFNVPFVRPDASVCLEIDVASRTVGSGSSSFTYSVGSGIASMTVSINGIGTSYTGYYARPRRDSLCFNTSLTNIPITVTYLPNDPVTSIGLMNYLLLNARRDLKFTGDQFLFRDVQSVGPGHVAEFSLDVAGNVYRIWDITDPTTVSNVPFTNGGALKTFRMAADTLREYIAFRNANFLTPTPIGRVPNQDLHATDLPTDLVIVCPVAFQGQAARLAERRAQEGLNVVMVSPQQIFNEFSSGARDATAIKKYMKMLYDRAGPDAGLLPRYLLLFGDGSFNNFNASPTNQNYIPTYQSLESLELSRSYTSDDYFGLLDDTEGELTSDLVDLGIGRLPVSSLLQATQAVDKILGYDQLTLLSTADLTCAGAGDGGASDWRNLVVFASDDQEGENFEGTIHMLQSDQLATRVENEHPEYNVSKIYLDAYRQITTLGVQRYPEAEQELKDRVQKGALLVNYIGHGGEVGWAHERFLNNSTILGWTNRERLPLFMTATCEFTRWDDPVRTSAGEYVFLNPTGGGIALMTTTRLAYSFQNYTLAGKFYDHVFEDTDELDRTARLGDVFRRTKMAITALQPSQNNHRGFTLMGDPTTRLAMPRQKVEITSVTDTLGQAVDTLRALATVRISGHVLRPDGTVDTDFNGVVLPTVYDKRVAQSTLANDGGVPFNYSIRKNIIYRGKVSVVDGLFSCTFVVPKDIAYQVGPGRVSVYAEGYTSNAIGYSNDLLVGDTDTNAVADAVGPRIDLYLNDERFVRGGLTNEAPLIFAKLFDENGINTVGNGIGHDLLAVVDENTERAMVLNDYYEADLNTYRSGKVRYRLKDLTEGRHILSLKAWDAHNNSSVATTEFVVASSAELALDHVLNYPNPFTTNTSFYFEHNRPCSTLEVQVQVFTVSGRLVKTLNRRLTCEGFRAEPMAWDGRDDSGDKLGRGVYVYRLHVTSPEGSKAEKYEKLVILR